MTPEEDDAYRLLARLKIYTWNKPPEDPKRELERTIGLVECAFGELAGTIPEPVRKRAIEFLKQCQPPTGRRGGYSLAWRDQVIIETVDFLCAKYSLEPTRNPARQTGEHSPCACSIVAEALRELGINLTEKAVSNIWSRTVPN